MNRPIALTLTLLLGLPAFADDAEYLLQGHDRLRGDFTGRLVLHPDGPDGYRADRHVQFARGTEVLLGGRGHRSDWRLQVQFTDESSLAAAIQQEGAQAPVQLRVAFRGDGDGTVFTSARRENVTTSKGNGFRVFPAEICERPETTGPSYTYQPVRGVAFLQGEGDAHEVDVNDVAQGGLGDCYLMAGIASVARTHPHRIRSMIETNADGTFTVYLWQHAHLWRDDLGGEGGEVKATRIVVDDAFPTTGNGPCYAKWGDTGTLDGVEVRELWPMILEKAYAKHKASYKDIEGGWAPTAMSFFSGQDDVVDHRTSSASEAELRAILQEATDQGYPVSVGVPESVSNLEIYGNHYYSFGGLDAQGRAKLLNPWGSSHPVRPLTMAELKAHIDWIHVGKF